jgi:hypothetical protein
MISCINGMRQIEDTGIREHRRIFGPMAGGWRNLHVEEFQNLHSSSQNWHKAHLNFRTVLRRGTAVSLKFWYLCIQNSLHHNVVGQSLKFFIYGTVQETPNCPVSRHP